MKFWPSIVPDNIIPFFSPPLVYNADGSDADPSLVINKSKRGSIESSRPFKRDSLPGRQLHGGSLIISSFPSHSAKDLCESATSIGPDFVSTIEGIYCDMAAKEWWYLCSTSLVTGCFDLTKTAMVGNVPGNAAAGTATTVNGTAIQSRDTSSGRVIPVKTYDNTVTWG
jgi:hypothetical protein